jgi:hypothetical protein
MRGHTDLENKLKVEDLDKYANNKKCEEITHHIACSVKESIVTHMKASELFSVSLYGSTDRLETEEIIMYVRYVNGGGLKKSFLSVTPSENDVALAT